MKSKTQEYMPNMNKYDVSIAIIIVLAAIFILAVCIWFGPASATLGGQSPQLQSSPR